MEFDAKFELCEMPDEEIAGRAKIKMSALKISSNDDDNNENGINWVRKYVKNNIKSLIGASYKVTFTDDDKTYPSGHGNMQYDEDGNIIFPDSDSIGSIQDAYLEDIEMDGGFVTVLSTEGYIYKQSYPNFYNWLKEEAQNNEIYGSVEINGKGNSKTIVYDGDSKDEGGNPKIGRKPKVFDFTALAILSDFVPPADKFSRILEVNSKEGEVVKKVKDKQNIEINELSYDDLATLITRAFNKTMSNSDYTYNFWIYKFYPVSGRVIFQNYESIPYKYYLTTYEISNNSVTLGEITEVEQDWKPVNNEESVEINASLIKDNLRPKSKEVKLMDEKIVLELNQKIEDKTNEINDLNTKNTSLNDKNIELNEAVVNANKALEDANSKIVTITEEFNSVTAELNELKAEKEKAESAKVEAEVNSYFKTEIPKNKFTAEEIKTLEPFVEAHDLAGLKAAESELCTKKFKEMVTPNDDNDGVEVNSASTTFISIHEKEKKVVTDETVKFFN